MAGPPVEVQVRVNTGGSMAGCVFNWKMISPGIATWPVGGKDKNIKQMGQGSTVITLIIQTIQLFEHPPFFRKNA